jgi:hypothetical protein
MLFGFCSASVVMYTLGVCTIDFKCYTDSKLETVSINSARSFLYGLGQLIGWYLGTLTLNTLQCSPMVLQLI